LFQDFSSFIAKHFHKTHTKGFFFTL